VSKPTPYLVDNFETQQEAETRPPEFTDVALAPQFAEADSGRLKPILWSDLHKLPKREPLIEGLLDCGALSLMFGPSGCGKTFFALDLAAHIAVGQPWRGREVFQGAAIYIAAEGGYGILNRLNAFSCKYLIDPKDVPFYVIPEPIDLCNSDGDLRLVIERLRDLPVRLIAVDTVSRALAGGNENSSDHMGALVSRCDKLRAATGAHVTLLHHTGKDINQGARGHSLLRAAVDTEIEMTWDKEGQTGLANVTKQRDSRTEGAFAFKLAEIDVELRDDEIPVTSCVVVPIEEDGSAVTTTSKAPRLTKAAQTALRALGEAVTERGDIPLASNHIPPGVRVVTVDQWRQYAYLMGISTSQEDRAKQQAFKRASEYLIGGGHVACWDDQVWLTKE
jgi:AAA domain